MKQKLVLKKYESIEEVLLDRELAGLGDTYVNFIYSLAMSQKSQRPVGAKVNNRILAEALKKSGLRKLLPHRIDRHIQGNAAEAIIVFAWLTDVLSFEDCLKTLRENDNVTEAFANLLRNIWRKLGAAYG